MKEKINHPSHYASDSGIECIDIIARYPFEIGSAIKYLWRAGKKEGESKEDDLRKALWYVEHAAKGLADGEREWVSTECAYLKKFNKTMGKTHWEIGNAASEDDDISAAISNLLEVGLDNETSLEPMMMLRHAQFHIMYALGISNPLSGLSPEDE